jgi:4-amino-4-deoxy-L-arabinose transferase-like glycosyltransferase
VLLIILIAAVFRLWQLDEIPPGLTHDEADTGYFVAAVYRGSPSPIEAPYGYANEPFTMYSGALFMRLLGPNYIALRVHSVFWGLALLVFAYLWARRAFGVAVGLVGAAIIATSYWALSNSRFALNSEPAAALFAGAVLFLWVALYNGDRQTALSDDVESATQATQVATKKAASGSEKHERWWAWVFFALCLAGSLYAYEAARAAAMAIAAFIVFLALFDRQTFRRRGLWFAGALVLAALLAAPHLLNPDAWQRSSTLSAPLEAARDGDLGPLLTNVRSALATFNISGDSFVTYNLPGRPIFGPVLSLLFIVGIGWCLWHWREPACALLLLWVAAGVLPSLVIGEWTSTLHSKGAEAAILLLPAIGIVALGTLVNQRYDQRWTRLFIVGGLAWLTVVAIFTWRDYFQRWGQAPETRAAYFHNLTAITEFVDQLPPDSVVALSSPFPDIPLDPFIADMRIERDDLTLGWFDARRALLLQSAGRSIVLLPSSTPLASEFSGWLSSADAERVTVHSEDVDPYFDVLALNPNETWEEIASRLPGVPAESGSGPTSSVDFGGAVEMVGYELTMPSVPTDEPVILITAWRVVDPEALGPVDPRRYGRRAAIFAHVLDESGSIVGQDDRLDVPAWNWQPGDRFIQLHRIVPDSELTPGQYQLALGLYTWPDLARLPVLAGGEPVGDHILLPPVEVKAP